MGKSVCVWEREREREWVKERERERERAHSSCSSFHSNTPRGSFIVADIKTEPTRGVGAGFRDRRHDRPVAAERPKIERLFDARTSVQLKKYLPTKIFFFFRQFRRRWWRRQNFCCHTEKFPTRKATFKATTFSPIFASWVSLKKLFSKTADSVLRIMAFIRFRLTVFEAIGWPQCYYLIQGHLSNFYLGASPGPSFSEATSLFAELTGLILVTGLAQ